VLTGARFVHTISPGRAPGTYLVTIDPGSTAELVAMLAAGGVAIEGVHRRTEDLEEIYRRQFGKEADRG
jgi:hypothetical protein